MEGRWTLEYIVSGVLQLKEVLHHIDVDINTIAPSFNIIIIIITTALLRNIFFLSAGAMMARRGELPRFPCARLISPDQQPYMIQRRKSTLIPAFSFPGLDDIRLDRTLLVGIPDLTPERQPPAAPVVEGHAPLFDNAQ
ncbi:hypothetical protein CSOJ01_05234 [Colletotrichum sojae]|uniref:Uncharacterized protein n=1 Tax=Colletotrichum sojae TaxID=2175907 RepID=A0A8H6JFP0_9PEZI|nr:hypothetical protein CSOJ01_05234 [Colletotrichum sojae]